MFNIQGMGTTSYQRHPQLNATNERLFISKQPLNKKRN
jgi:hypothetical protein